MKTKSFDCVQMKRDGQELVQMDLEHLNREEELEYWRKIAEEMRAHRAKAKQFSPELAGR